MIRDVPAFELAGVGTAPASSQSAQPSTAAAPETQSTSRSATEPATQSQEQARAAVQGQSGASADGPKTGRELWAILSAMTALMIAGTVFIARRRKRTSKSETTADRGQEPSMVDAIQDELKQLEIEKLYGAISAEEYESARQALSVSLERVMARAQN
jgi:LPXTG-motif cell wall-anchored protein